MLSPRVCWKFHRVLIPSVLGHYNNNKNKCMCVNISDIIYQICLLYQLDLYIWHMWLHRWIGHCTGCPIGGAKPQLSLRVRFIRGFTVWKYSDIFTVPFWSYGYGGRESSTRCNFRKHMQIEKAPANQENIFIILTADGANGHNTNK